MPVLLIRIAALGAVTLLAACVSHRPAAVTVETTAAAFPDHPSGPLVFEEAVRLLVAGNPELRATRARISAVNLRPGGAVLGASQRVLDGEATEFLVRTDILALLGLGSRGAELAWARAVRDERVRQHHERARALVAELAEAYAVDEALRALPSPAADLDLAAFEKAGLASKSVLSAGRSVAAEAAAEAALIELRRQSARLAVARLIGAGPTAAVEPVGGEAPWPTVEPADRDRLVLARGDLQSRMAAWHSADRRYRFEVDRQYPGLSVGLGGQLELRSPLQLISVSLPIDAPARARAAERARAVAFHELEAATLAALHDAESSALELEARRAEHTAGLARLQAAKDLLAAGTANLEVTPEGLGPVVLVAGRYVDAARRVRTTAVALARARVRAAHAAGWPTPAVVGENR